MRLRKQADQPRRPRSKYTPPVKKIMNKTAINRPSQVDPCPVCGDNKAIKSKLCWGCYSKNRGKPPIDRTIHKIDGYAARCIPLSKGLYATVDKKLYHFLMQWVWSATSLNGSCVYAITKTIVDGELKTILMHRMIMSLYQSIDGMKIDHRDGNGINNLRNNLRKCTQAENCRNHRMKINNTSGFMGVSWNRQTRSWVAQITCNYKAKRLGHYNTAEIAARVRDEAAMKLHGRFARLNFPNDVK